MTTCQLLQRIFIASVACLFLAVAPSVQAEWLVIDDFEDVPSDVEGYALNYLGNDWSHSSTIAGVLGGQRDLSVALDLSNGGTPTPTSALGLVGHDRGNPDGVFQLRTGGAVGSTATMTYDGSDPVSLLNGSDLTVGSERDGIILNFLSLDAPGDQPLEVRVDVTGAGGAEAVSLTTSVPVGTNPFYHFIPLDDPDWDGFDFTDVDSIEFVFNPSAALDVDMDLGSLGIGIDPELPEPSTWAMLSVGIFVIAFRGWRRRKSS